jgi:hypothetical protein
MGRNPGACHPESGIAPGVMPVPPQVNYYRPSQEEHGSSTGGTRQCRRPLETARTLPL